MKDTKKQVRIILKQLYDQGWRIDESGRKHIHAFPTDKTKPMISISSTPGDFRAIQKIYSNLRNAGADLKKL